jgi:hypothetical protein
MASTSSRPGCVRNGSRCRRQRYRRQRNANRSIRRKTENLLCTVVGESLDKDLSSQKNRVSLSIGAIAGLAAGGGLILALIVSYLVFCVLRRRRGRNLVKEVQSDRRNLWPKTPNDSWVLLIACSHRLLHLLNMRARIIDSLRCPETMKYKSCTPPIGSS